MPTSPMNPSSVVGGPPASAATGALSLRIEHTGDVVSLGPADYLAEGGQGRVFARGDTAFKVYHDASTLPPADKLAFLSRLQAPGLVAPGPRLLDAAGEAVGFCLPLVVGAHPLARAATHAFRQRHNLGTPQALRLVEQMRQTLVAVHRQGALVVDLNEMNLLLDDTLSAVHFIDLDAWQVPGHPATALLDSVRDRHAAVHGHNHPLAGALRFDTGTDWFAFAVTAFQFLIGVHPYKGAHPTLTGLDARMGADCSVFDLQVRRPPTARDPAELPDDVAAWFRAVFQDRFRGPPCPFDRHRGRTRRPVAALPSDAGELSVQRLYTVPEVPEADATLQAVVEGDVDRLALSPEAVWIEHRRALPRPPGAVALAWLGSARRPVAAWVQGGRLCVQDVDSQQRWACDFAARAVMQHEGVIYALGADTVVAVQGVGDAGGGVVTLRVVARVRPQASVLFEGVLLQRVPGARLATVFVAPGRALTVTLPDLADGEVIAAQAAGTVLVVVMRRGDRLDRHRYRLDPPGACRAFAAQRTAPSPTAIPALPILDDASASPPVGALDSPPDGRTSLDGSMRNTLPGGPPDAQVQTGVDFAEASVAVLPSGLAVIQTAPDALTLLPAAPRAPGERTVQAPTLTGLNGVLMLPGGALGARIGPHLARLRIR